jgi:hypothetical protein
MSDFEAAAYAAALGKRGGGATKGGRRKKTPPMQLGVDNVIEPMFEHDLPTQIVNHGASMLSSPVIADAAELYAHAKAQKEAALAATQELMYKRKAGMYLPRDDVRRAAATAFSSVAQSLRSIPDLLERQIGLDPTIAERIGVIIDNHLAELSEELKRLHTASTADEVSD